MMVTERRGGIIIIAAALVAGGFVAAPFVSPSIALRFLNSGLRETWRSGGDPVILPEDVEEFLVISAPMFALRNNRKALPSLLACTVDQSLKYRTRVVCAQIAFGLSPTAEEREDLKNPLLELAGHQFQYRGALVTDILPNNFGSDPDVIRFLLEEAGKEKDPALIYRLGKMKLKPAIPVIERLIRDGDSQNYIALGRIGGPEAYDALMRLGPPKKSVVLYTYLASIGLTRDPRAKAFLISRLASPDFSVYSGALRGLGVLGDPTTLPAIEKQLQNHKDAESQFLIKRAMAAIRKGGGSLP